MSQTVIAFKNVKSKPYHNEVEKIINIFYPTKRDALVAQKNLRNRLLNSLTVYSFRDFVYSRHTYRSATHWSTEVHGNAMIVKIVKVRKYGN